jgi:hypothetical protein
MKMMTEYMQNMLQGELEVITATELRARPGECFTQASLGKSFCIIRKGKIVAFLVPPGEADVVHPILPDGTSPTLGIASEVK